MRKLGFWAVLISFQVMAGNPSRADTGLEPLLRKIEKQVSIGHAMAPFDDNAMETWQAVLVFVQPQRLSLDADEVHALRDFVTRLRNRAAAEKIGRPVVASDFMVFADQATRLLGAPPDPTPPVASAPAPTPVQVVPPPMASPPSPAPRVQTPVIISVTPAPTKTPMIISTASPPVVKPVASVGTPQAAYFAQRGDEMLAHNDISAARKFFESAANAGNAHAAFVLAKTYDGFFTELVFTPDPVAAAFWYRKAAELGDTEAMARLKTFK